MFSQPEQRYIFGSFCKPGLLFLTHPYYHMPFGKIHTINVQVSRCWNVGKSVQWITTTKDVEHHSARDSTDPYGFHCPHRNPYHWEPRNSLNSWGGKKSLLGIIFIFNSHGSLVKEKHYVSVGFGMCNGGPVFSFWLVLTLKKHVLSKLGNYPF